MSPEAEAKGADGDPNIPEDGVSNAPPRTRPWIAWRQELGDPTCPYLVRWVLDLRVFSVRLHHWVRSDDKRAMHDHSWWFVTLVLKGGYTDWTYAPHLMHSLPGEAKRNAQGMTYTEDHLRRWSVRYRPSHHVHTVAVDPGGCWTLMLTGRFVRKYGFYVRKASGLLKFRKANKYFFEHGNHRCDQP